MCPDGVEGELPGQTGDRLEPVPKPVAADDLAPPDRAMIDRNSRRVEQRDRPVDIAARQHGVLPDCRLDGEGNVVVVAAVEVPLVELGQREVEVRWLVHRGPAALSALAVFDDFEVLGHRSVGIVGILPMSASENEVLAAHGDRLVDQLGTAQRCECLPQ